jgi:hypothetical protein
VNDKRVETEIRAWFETHTERTVPESLRQFLSELPNARPELDRVPSSRPHSVSGQDRVVIFRALAACVAVVLVVAVLGYGLSQRPGPVASFVPASGSPLPTPNGSPRPSSSTVATAVLDAAPVDAAHGWALTSDDLVWTDDGGSTWRSIRPPSTAADETIEAVHFLDLLSGWIVGWSPGTGSVTVSRTIDGGQTWSASQIPDAYPDGVGGVSIDSIGGDTVWVQVEGVHGSAASSGGLYQSQDGGHSWVPGVATPGGWPVGFASRFDGWTFAGPMRDRLEATHDGGLTWHEVTVDLPPGHREDARSFELPRFFGAGGIPKTGVLPVTLYRPPDPGSGDQHATLAMYTTDDGGATWRFATTIGSTTAVGEGVTIASMIFDQTVWLVASDPQRGTLSFTKDGGHNWDDVGSTGLAGVSELRYAAAAEGWALTQSQGADYQLSATRNGGRTWRRLDPVATQSVTPSEAPAPYRWSLVSSGGDLAAYSVAQGIQRGDGRYLAIAMGQEARILTSPDGRSWTVEPADPGLTAAPADHLNIVNGVAEGATGFLAVGATALDDFSSGDARAWTSSDGLAWHAAVASGGLTDAEMLAVTATRDGYLAVGSAGFPGANTQLPGARAAAVWTSTDGSRWTRLATQPSFDHAIMTGVRRLETGYVAWGQTLVDVPGPPRLPPIWTSPDGAYWDRASGITDAGGPGTPISAIVRTGSTLVAVGTRQLPDVEGAANVPGAWTSSDGGRTWIPAAVTPNGADSELPGGMFDAVVDGSSLIAVGHVESRDGQCGPGSAAVWGSSDEGRTWAGLPDDPTFAGNAMRHLIAGSGVIVAFGENDDPNATTNTAIIWAAVPTR